MSKVQVRLPLVNRPTSLMIEQYQAEIGYKSISGPALAIQGRRTEPSGTMRSLLPRAVIVDAIRARAREVVRPSSMSGM